MTTAALIATISSLAAIAQAAIHARRVHADALPEGWRAAVRMLALLGFAAISAVALAGHRTGEAPTGLLVTALVVGFFAPRLVEEISYERAPRTGTAR